ncbi:MAG: hypothetical protein ABGY24_08645 [bacterium]
MPQSTVQNAYTYITEYESRCESTSGRGGTGCSRKFGCKSYDAVQKGHREQQGQASAWPVG